MHSSSGGNHVLFNRAIVHYAILCRTLLWRWYPLALDSFEWLFCMMSPPTSASLQWGRNTWDLPTGWGRMVKELRLCGGRCGSPWLLCGKSFGHGNGINGSTAAGETLVSYSASCTTTKWPKGNWDCLLFWHCRTTLEFCTCIKALKLSRFYCRSSALEIGSMEIMVMFVCGVVW